jgi:hypothetical protein
VRARLEALPELLHRASVKDRVRARLMLQLQQKFAAGLQKKGLSFITNRQRRNEGTFCAPELAGIEPTPPAPKGAGYVRLDHSATVGMARYQSRAWHLGRQLHRDYVNEDTALDSPVERIMMVDRSRISAISTCTVSSAC